jgi:putative PIN family toxin of toxin-antitoxin system
VIAVVFDTNTLAAGIVGSQNPASPPGTLVNAWRRGALDLVTSEHILTELRLTLAKPYFRRRISPDDARAVEALVRRFARVVPITIHVAGIADHPEDDLVLATALSAGVPYLITGDAGLQRVGRYQDVTILSPRAFLPILEGAQSDEA